MKEYGDSLTAQEGQRSGVGIVKGELPASVQKIVQVPPDTVLRSATILKVLDAGRIRAFAEPLVLLQDPDSIFFKMVQQTGKQEASALHEAAKRVSSTGDTSEDPAKFWQNQTGPFLLQAFNSSHRLAALTNGHLETADGHLVIFEMALSSDTLLPQNGGVWPERVQPLMEALTSSWDAAPQPASNATTMHKACSARERKRAEKFSSSSHASVAEMKSLFL
ncbi:uncharacterized protein LOC144990190 [Oryzias latipes]